MKSRETVCFNIKYSWHSISRMYNDRALKHGTTAAVGFILLNIDPEKGTPATQIGPTMGMESTSLSRVFKSMEEDGLIERKNDHVDKRKVTIFLTTLGKQKRAIAKEYVLDFNTRVRDKISDKKLNTFLEVLQEIQSIIDTKNTSLT
jgi:MarR family transcriptional regulator, organic hydroperoxide resistance regulator